MSISRRRLLGGASAAGLLCLAHTAQAAGSEGRRLRASPSNYRARLHGLRAGDVLLLAPGEYTRGLPLHGLIGSPSQPIVIEGPQPPARAVFTGRSGAHTVSLLDSAYVVVRDLVLDGRGAAVDAVRAEGHARWAHHVTLERLTISNHAASQQNSGISTKCPAWGWVVRGNTIARAGTGMYFGDSDGTDAFFDSLIEGNRVVDPVGYGIQIKHQRDRPSMTLASTDPAATIIRRNVISKARVAVGPELARPNLLVGHWPLSGPGATDRYLIYGNLLFDNPSEALFQGEGNIAFYNNLLVNPRGEGMRIQPHNHKPRDVAVFNNTIVAAALGVGFVGGEPGYARLFEHNLIFGNPPMQSEVHGENLVGDYDRARAAFVRLGTELNTLDLRPRAPNEPPRSAIGERWLSLPDARRDFTGSRRVRAQFGACPLETAIDKSCG